MKLKQNRRNFLQISTTSMAIIGTGLAIWPFIDSMNPSADVLAVGMKEVNLDGIKKGTSLTVKWRGKPVFIKHRTDEEIKQAQETNIDQLKDPQKDQDRIIYPEWLVVVGVCTHLGCIPSGKKKMMSKEILMDGFVHVMDHIMIHQEELEKDQLQKICKFRNIFL